MNEIVGDDRLGAFCHETHVELEGARSGPLAGLSFALKDIYDVAGARTGFGNPDWLRTHGPAPRTAPAVQRLLEAGARLVGKTRTDEMAWSLTGANAHYGAPINVNAPGRLTGGSSSGSAAVVAAGVVDFAIGSDTGGSVRLPASFCGILGMRPTHGRIPLEGVRPLAPSFDTCGWFARDPEVLERVGRVLLQDAAPAPRPQRLLLARDAFELCGGALAQALAPALAALAARLGAPQPVAVAVEPLARWAECFRVIQAAEAWAEHGEWVQRVRPALGPGVEQRFAWARTVDAAALARARAQREAIAQRMARLLEGDAVLALPSAPCIAPLRESPPAELEALRERALPLLSIAGLARLPQISLPFATLQGCPLGLSLIAARARDTMLLDLAKHLADFRPPAPRPGAAS
jgi:amidase